MITASYHLYDVFTSHRFGGNQLAVFPKAELIDPALFQKIASELNIAETVFLFSPDPDGCHAMRIFTPKNELPTAGHPTIGTAYFLSSASKQPLITLRQQVGDIKVKVDFAGDVPNVLTMYQPLPRFGPIHNDMRAKVASMLSLKETELADYPIQEVSCGNNILLVPLKDAKTLAMTKLNISIWDELKPHFHGAFTYCFTVKGLTEGDVKGRMFAPDAGIPEDPATGSANGPLGCYLIHHGIKKTPMLSLQGYEMGRPSQLFVDITTDDKNEISEVKVGGKCVYVGKGELFLSEQ